MSTKLTKTSRSSAPPRAAGLPLFPSPFRALVRSRPGPLFRPEPRASLGSAAFGGDAGEGLLLAGDIGGTRTVLALVAETGSSVRVVGEAVFPSREYATPETVMAAFRAAYPAPVRRAAFSVAGPVIGGHAHITNVPWRLDQGCLATAIGVELVLLVNDLQAAGLHPGRGGGDRGAAQPGHRRRVPGRRHNPRTLSMLRGRASREGFLQKGPMSRLMGRIPVFVILEPRAALLGAARYGLAMAGNRKQE